MSHFTRFAAAVAIALATVALAGCPGAGEEPERATVTVSADLSPAFDAGIQVDGVSIDLAGGQSIQFALSVDAASKSAAGSRTEVPLGDYTATVSVREGTTVVGAASGQVAVRGDTTITVTIVITVQDGDDGGETGGSIEIDLQ
jgi:hypothetical protein